MIDFLLDNSKVKKAVNQNVVNSFMNNQLERPLPLSTFSNTAAPRNSEIDFYRPENWKVEEYISWNSLTNKKFFNRLLPCATHSFIKRLPPVEEVQKLFLRGNNIMIPSESTTVLFMSFAQWFTDGFFISDVKDIRKCESTHQVDLCQIYGLDNKTTNILRKKKDGLLKSQFITVTSKNKTLQELPPYLFTYDKDLNKCFIKKEFKELPYLHRLNDFYKRHWKDQNRKSKMYATGIFRGNMTVGHSTLNTLFLRSHNKLARLLKEKHPLWDDDRLFETARNINLRIFLTIVIEDYIEHLDSTNLELELNNRFAENEHWYRENWVSIEFNLLYRWHSMIPDTIKVNDQTLETSSDFHLNNKLIENNGIASILEDLSFQKSGKITSLWNSPNFMKHVEGLSINTGRALRLKSYNDYREAFGLKRIESFESFSNNTKVQKALKGLYNCVDDVEFYVGIFADDKLRDSPTVSKLRTAMSDGSTPILGELMNKMVAYEAFSQILTNPLLSRNLNEELAFTKEGLRLIKKIRSFTDLLKWVEGKRYNVSFNGLW